MTISLSKAKNQEAVDSRETFNVMKLSQSTTSHRANGGEHLHRSMDFAERSTTGLEWTINSSEQSTSPKMAFLDS